MYIFFKYRFEDEVISLLDEIKCNYNEDGSCSIGGDNLLKIEVIEPTPKQVKNIKNLPLNSYYE